MKINLDELSAREINKFLCSIVILRLIAWVTTINRQGLVNVAPFSSINVFGAEPATVILGLEHHAGGSQKNTTRNIEETSEYTINILTPDLNDVIVANAACYSADIGEAMALELELTPSAKIAPHRLTCAPVSLGCRKNMALSLSLERSTVIGEAIALSAHDGLIDVECNYVNWNGNHPTSSFYGDKYARLVKTESQIIPARAHEITHKNSEGYHEIHI